MPESALEARILVLAPTGRDAALACEVLGRVDLRAEPCLTAEVMCHELERGAGALLIAEEALSVETRTCLERALALQQPWSDLPVVVFATPVDGRAAVARTQELLGVLGNVTFVERPARVPSLVTALRAALRARRRQYEARTTLEALALAEAAARTRADFEQQLIGIVSHDLRNPLNAILLSAQALLRRENVDERTLGTAARIKQSGERANRLIRDLLDFTQARLGGGLQMSPRRLDLHELARQALDEVQAAFPDRLLVLETHGEGPGSWDPDRIAQVLTNLLTNALKYSPEGTPVTLRSLGDEPSEVVLAVHNEGAPISDALRARLFEPMQRGEAPRDFSTRSVGLGLYIVDHIVRAHGGSTSVTSSLEAGTTFRIRLPRVTSL